MPGDADMDRFHRKLKETSSGLRLRLAITEAAIAVRMVQRIVRESGVLKDPASRDYANLQAWRRQYIKASEIGSTAIGELWEAHQWPTDAGRSQVYQYKPKNPA